MTFTYITVALALGTATLMLVSSRRDPKKFKQNLWWAFALFALAAVQGYAVYRENLASAKLQRVRVEIEAIRTEVAAGRPWTAEEAKMRSDRLKELSERLNAVRRR